MSEAAPCEILIETWSEDKKNAYGYSLGDFAKRMICRLNKIRAISGDVAENYTPHKNFDCRTNSKL